MVMSSSDSKDVPRAPTPEARPASKPQVADNRCSFCGEHQHAAKLIAGPSVYICNECVEICSQLLQEETRKGDRKPPPFHVLVDELDVAVVGHRRQKEMLASIFASHAQHGRDAPRGEPRHVFLVGPRGTGKSRLVEVLADELALPVVVADAARLHPHARVGTGVLAALVDCAGSASAAQRGVVCIEHVDDAFANEHHDSGRLLQRTLLDLMTLDSWRSSDAQEALDVSRLLFVLTSNSPAAFSGGPPGSSPPATEALQAVGHDGARGLAYGNPLGVTPTSLIRAGMTPELVDRLGVIVSFERLSKGELTDILGAPNGPLDTHSARLAVEGRELRITDEAVEVIASVASTANDGARALWRLLGGLVNVASCTRSGDSAATELVLDGSFVKEHLALE
jgi:ATP-dependent Clp protease ATP-binding subunit ClpX